LTQSSRWNTFRDCESDELDVGELNSRYPLDPRLDGIFIYLTKVCGVNTSQQWSISDQVAPRPTPIVISNIPL